MFPRVNALDAAQIDAILCGVRASLVMGVDTTGFAKIVLRRMGSPRVKRQVVGTFNYLHSAANGRHGSSLSARAE